MKQLLTLLQFECFVAFVYVPKSKTGCLSWHCHFDFYGRVPRSVSTARFMWHFSTIRQLSTSISSLLLVYKTPIPRFIIVHMAVVHHSHQVLPVTFFPCCQTRHLFLCKVSRLKEFVNMWKFKIHFILNLHFVVDIRLMFKN